jgi:hypothetical protein
MLYRKILKKWNYIDATETHESDRVSEEVCHGKGIPVPPLSAPVA